MEKLSLSSDTSKALDNKSAEANRARLALLEEEITNLKVEQQTLTQRWEAEKGAVEGVTELQEQIANIQFEIEKAEREYDLERAAELKYGTLPELEARLEAAKPLEEERALNGEEEGEEGSKLLRDEVVAEDIANVISVWTGIPANKMLDSEKNKVLAMGEKLKERVVGQDEAIDVVTQSIQRSRAGLNDPSKPIASLIFLGPTGVGKTELAKALSEFMFDTEEAMIRIDMSEYMEKHTVSRLLGAPPGYVGYDEGGQLTDAVRRRPYSVLLFDEMEKAHPDVFNVMLQMLDDGRVTDSKGRVVDFKNCVIIFTSNIGSQDIIDLGEEDQDEMRVRVFNAMKENFKPEFLNRIDDTVIFNSLSKENLRGIVNLEVKKLEKRLAEKDMSMIITSAALDTMANIGFDPVFGARPLKRAIQRELETKVAKGILRGDFADGDEITIDSDDMGQIVIYKSGVAQSMAEPVYE
jgi:ATP-dependent Clp protease ATP-binding subunit ClpB